MSVTLGSIRASLGSLIDLTPKAKSIKIKKYKLALKYNLYDDDVNAAWADTARLIAESYKKVADDQEFDKQFKSYQNYFKSFEKELDLTESISLEKISKCIADYQCEAHKQKKIKKIKKINGKFQLSYE